MDRNRSVHDLFTYAVLIHLCDLCAFARVISSVFEQVSLQFPAYSNIHTSQAMDAFIAVFETPVADAHIQA